MAENRITGFAPVADERAGTLILGTMPSVKSLRESFYYAHPQNAFWRILSDVYAAPPPASREEKIKLLLENRLALWDVCASCVRPGSLDSSIRSIEPNDIPGLLARHSRIRRILLNGQTAEKLLRRHFPDILKSFTTIALPSTSPAHTLRYPNKLEAWRAALGEEPT